MAASTKSEYPRTLNKETNSDIPSLRGDDCELANTKILRRATLKIDLYLIPILGTICTAHPPFTTSQCSSALRSFVILGGCLVNHRY